MPKPPKKPELEEIETEPGPTKDTKFQKVVQTFLKTPPRQHQEDVGKAVEKRSSRTGAPAKGKAKQKQREAR